MMVARSCGPFGEEEETVRTLREILAEEIWYWKVRQLPPMDGERMGDSRVAEPMPVPKLTAM